MISDQQAISLLHKRFNYRYPPENNDPALPPASISLTMADFSLYVKDLLSKSAPEIILKPVFDTMEELLIQGDSDVQNAVATCFLENLLNFSSEPINNMPVESFSHFLGKASREYCVAWDTFTGVDSGIRV